MSEEVPRGSRVDCKPNPLWPLMVDGREGMEGRREVLRGEAELEGGVAGKMGSGVPLGSGEGLMVKTEDNEGGGRGCDLMTDVLYSESLFRSGSLPDRRRNLLASTH
jgi:hypothetical protein